MVGTDQVVQFGFGEPGCVIAKCINRVRNTVAIQFLCVEFAPVYTCERQPQKPQSNFGGGRLLLWLERRPCGGDDEQPVERQFLQSRLRHEYVTVVHWVE